MRSSPTFAVRASNQHRSLPFKAPSCLPRQLAAVRACLHDKDAKGLEKTCKALIRTLCLGLAVVPPPKIRVRGCTNKDGDEGLLIYQPFYEEDQLPPVSTKLVVHPISSAGRYHGFWHLIELVVHELMHHCDFALLQLYHTYHTPGFKARVASLLGELKALERESRRRKAA